MDGAQITINGLRKQITHMEFELMEPEPCVECLKMRAVHLAVAVIDGFDLKSYSDAPEFAPKSA